jgi:hypothetical protein
MVSMAEKCLQMAAAMYDAEDKRVLVFDAVDDHVFPHGQATVAGADVLFSRPPDIGKLASVKKRSVIVSIRRLAISMLPLSLAT